MEQSKEQLFLLGLHDISRKRKSYPAPLLCHYAFHAIISMHKKDSWACVMHPNPCTLYMLGFSSCGHAPENCHADIRRKNENRHADLRRIFSRCQSACTMRIHYDPARYLSRLRLLQQQDTSAASAGASRRYLFFQLAVVVAGAGEDSSDVCCCGNASSIILTSKPLSARISVGC